MTKAKLYRYLWAKADQNDPPRVHRLIYHLMDVGQVAKAFWQGSLSGKMRAKLSAMLNLPEIQVMNLLSYWAALHDLGKASPAFQIKAPFMLEELRQLGADIPRQIDKPTRHAIITAWAILHEDVFADSGLNPAWQLKLALLLSGHHGAWEEYHLIQSVPESEAGQGIWQEARRDIVNDLKNTFQPPTWNPRLDVIEQNTFLTLISGFISIVDWLGSNEEIFSYQDQIIPLPDYISLSEKKAWDGLQHTGWLTQPITAIPFDFAKLFNLPAPSPTQEKIIQLAGSTACPSLVMIESPTGSGKTEAALSLFALWTQTSERPGLYIAMPTTATSDQMFERTTAFLENRYQTNIAPILIHGRALLRDEDIQKINPDKIDEDPVHRLTWFLPRKRSLLSPFGVGTVDQAFLSVLQTRHFFVRLFGLSQKVVIFDEVHAYDAYMAEIFCRLLRWLRALDVSIILLSATLPASARGRFIEAYTGTKHEPAGVDYPRLTITSDQGVQEFPLPRSETRPALAIQWIQRTDDEIIQVVRSALNPTGCVAIIANTVRRAQELYTTLTLANQEHPFCPTDQLILFHARTTLNWREQIQKTVLDHLSKAARQNGNRPSQMVVVATQVIEQSLDLDFDAMITDIAPLDLLVQRAGRLHRHPPYQRAHPYQLVITLPHMKDGLPQFSYYNYPYEPYFLYRTWGVLGNVSAMTLAVDAPRLIEAVYGDQNLPGLDTQFLELMEKAKRDCEKDLIAAELDAEQSLITDPANPKLLGKAIRDLEEDNPEVNRALRALTRRSAPGISLVCVFQREGLFFLEPEADQPVDFEHPSAHQIVQLARNAIAVQSNRVLNHFIYQDSPQSWKKTPLLRYSRLAIFDQNQQYTSPEFTLQLNRALGLQIIYHKPGVQDDEI